MASKFTNKEIAHQAGLSLATVDRVLHGRDHVRALTRERVQAAAAELERQHAVSQLRGTKVTIDIVMQAPERFSTAVRAAFEAELPLIRLGTFRARFHLAEVMDEREIVALLRAIARRGTQGIVLKVPATPGIAACLADLAARKIPVVTYVTDVAAPLRLAYVGMPNERAGATAAFLLSRMAPRPPSRVLVTLSSREFEGEDARRIGFARYLEQNAPHLTMATVSEGFGVNRPTGALVGQALEAYPDIACVYSIGGGNRAILDAFAAVDRSIDVFAAHDLDRTNTELLESGQISFVIHHSFRQDARQVSLHFSKYYRLIEPHIQIEDTEISIACPINLA
ncbi:MAG: LacI family DNA-binding transcriptional regulator [Pseudotabrizicola sp.]|uniref:LacI family DNA-binding transcriptional regulator n=1 Tax=Pseudotabrizicola sp. TaxID=2939647 RepID=UPI00273132A9|nr:LacI family DNA-binding transcriptional regulator [Pseudotabrizicola sp.]MDP2079595.1 LacI family DNA-binding transcriptional regulator [Pseudotabrizicola sp.]MDZ7576364.1 LacI family DNA-binding transcriptional regulator [Pseudotabrizicola sp.]